MDPILPEHTRIKLDDGMMDLRVSAKYRKKFALTPEGDLTCLACTRAFSKAGALTRKVRAIPDDTCSILIPEYMTRPHECLLSTLRYIEDLYRKGFILRDLFDRWLSCSTEHYQLGNSPECMKLWDDFTSYKCRRQESEHYKKLDWMPTKTAVTLKKCRYHKGLYVHINWKKIKKKEDIKVLNDVWRWSSDADKAKTNISAADLIWHIKDDEEYRNKYDKWQHLFSVNLLNITAVSLLCHLLGNPNSIKVFELLDKHKLCCMDLDDFKQIFKRISVAIRRTGHWPNGQEATLEEVTGSAAWELAIGRSMNKSDWIDEEEKRTLKRVFLGDPKLEHKTEFTNINYCSDLKPILGNMMCELVFPPKRLVSWAEYVEDRQSWCSSGSTGGKKLKLNNGESVRMNKHTYFEQLTKEEMETWLDTEPEIVATASEKYEMGKARAIYGTQPIDYSIASYVLDGIESGLSNIDGIESGLVGVDFIATMIRRCAAASETGSECTMIDYADFNYQHTLEAQSLVFEVLADYLERMGHHEDKVRACKWIAKAMLNQKCQFPKPGSPMKRIVQGMFSGCRGTNFINTILNTAYFRLAKKWVEDNLGISPVDLHNIHQGDDVWISNKSRLWAMTTFEVMRSTGFIFQSAKQMFDVCRGEFLRVVYTDTGCRGYLGRAIGTLIMKPIQGADVVGPAERAVALNSQIMILRRRGMTEKACELLWRAMVPYAARSKLPNGALTLPVSFLTKSYLDGGLDLGYPGTAAERSNKVSPIPVMQLGSKVLESEVSTNMAQDWANVLSRKLQMPIDYDKVVELLHRSNVSDSLRTEDRMGCLRALERTLRKWLADNTFGPVQRNKAIYEALKEGSRADSVFVDDIRDLASNILGKRVRPNNNIVSNILRAVRASPYKSVETAKTATGQGSVAAIQAAILSVNNQYIRSMAMEGYNALLQKCGESVLAALVDGVRAGATKYEAEFHPTLLSWVQERALSSSIATALDDEIRSVDVLGELISQDFDRYVRSTRDESDLTKINYY